MKEDSVLQGGQCGAVPAAPQPGVLLALTILQRKLKLTPPRPPHQALLADATCGMVVPPRHRIVPTMPSHGAGAPASEAGAV